MTDQLVFAHMVSRLLMVCSIERPRSINFDASRIFYAGQSFGGRFDGGQVVRLMQGGQRNQLSELVQDLRCDDRRTGERDTAVNDTVADTQDAGAAVFSLALMRGAGPPSRMRAEPATPKCGTGVS